MTNQEAFYECTLFDSCQENKCPLASNYAKLQTLPEDIQLFGYKKCRLNKRKRVELGKKYALKNLGMTQREISFQRYWNSLSKEEQETKKRRLAQISPFLQLKKKGYAITRVGKVEDNFTLQNQENMPVARQKTEVTEEIRG